MANKATIGIFVNEKGLIVNQIKIEKGLSSDELSNLIVYVSCFLDDLRKLYRNKNIGTRLDIK